MKRIILFLLMAATFVQCTKDETAVTDTDAQDLKYQQVSLDLSKAIPNATLDTTNKGLYVGTLASTDLSFHEKIFINIENDANTYAQIITPETKHTFQGQLLSEKENTYVFTGNIGRFTVTLEEKEAVVTESTFYNKPAVVNIIKSKSTSRGVPSLGSFTNSDGSFNGTWDFMWQQTSPDSYSSSTLIIVRNGGASFNLPITSAFYTRTCLSMPDPFDPMGPDIYDILFDINVTGNTQLLDLQLDFDVNGASFSPLSFSCEPQPFDMPLASNSWSWNNKTGTVTLDVFSLPFFF